MSTTKFFALSSLVLLAALAGCQSSEFDRIYDKKSPAPYLPEVSCVSDFRALPDHRTAVHGSYGVRYACPVGPKTLEIGIGLSASDAINYPDSYRIISHDDPDYSYPRFIKPTSVKVKTETDCDPLDGCSVKAFKRHVVTLEIPYRLKARRTYYVLAQGGGGKDKGLMATAARTARGFKYNPLAKPSRPEKEIDLAVLGLRKVEPVGPDLIMAEFGASFAPSAGTDPRNYTVTINGKPTEIKNIGRRTMVEAYIPEGRPYVGIPFHEVFLELSTPFLDGDVVNVQVNSQVTSAMNEAEMAFDSGKTLTNSIKVNQIGYITDSPVKVAYLGRWLGSFPEGKSGNAALLYQAAPPFYVCDAESGSTVFTGHSELIHRSGDMNEGIRKIDHSGENVYLLDFTDFRTPGTYFIKIPQVGRSLEFEIADNVYKKAFEVQAYGVFAQRCGIELEPPHSQWHRIACHDQGITESEVSKLKLDESARWKALGDTPKDAPVLKTLGGHHDAGDYNPRSHIDVAQNLMDAYEIAPDKFYDGQLNIPETKNRVPDILDEAAWALRLWIGLQDKDGGVRNGTESNGDPNPIQTVELDTLGDYAFAKDAAGSFTFAGTTAQACRIWRTSGREKQEKALLHMAERAYEWAKKHKPTGMKSEAEQHKQWLDPMAFAAAELLLTTGKEEYNDDFLKAAVWKRNKQAELTVYKKYDQSRAAWAYARCSSGDTDSEVQDAARKAIIANADDRIAKSATMAYAFVRAPYSPISWGTGAYEQWLNTTIWAWHLTGDEKYRKWMIRTCDNTLGANPLNRSYIVNAGTRTVRAPLHNSRYSHFGEVVPGMQVEGPHHQGPGARVKEMAYPPLRSDFAVLYTFVDNHFAIAIDEGMVRRQAETMAVFGLLLKDKE